MIYVLHITEIVSPIIQIVNWKDCYYHTRGRIRLLFLFSSFIPNTPGITPGIMSQQEPSPVTLKQS